MTDLDKLRLCVAQNAWEVRISAYGVKHVVPLNDLREHDAADCWCIPTADGDIQVHHAMDKREEYEPSRSGPLRQPS